MVLVMPRLRKVVEHSRMNATQFLMKIGWQEQLEETLAEHLLALPPGQLKEIVIAIVDSRLAVEHDRDELNVAQHIAEPPVALPQLIRGPLALGDISQNSGIKASSAGFELRNRCFDLKTLAILAQAGDEAQRRQLVVRSGGVAGLRSPGEGFCPQ